MLYFCFVRDVTVLVYYIVLQYGFLTGFPAVFDTSLTKFDSMHEAALVHNPLCL